MSNHKNDDILDDVFHGCAWAAYLDQAQAEQGPPDCEATRRRAFRYYEEALAEKNCGALIDTLRCSGYTRSE